MTRQEPDLADPKSLIADSYAIDGIDAAQCRSIFLDWALSLPDGLPVASAARQLLARHSARGPDHPMTAILREAASGPPSAPRRRGGRGGRHAGLS